MIPRARKKMDHQSVCTIVKKQQKDAASLNVTLCFQVLAVALHLPISQTSLEVIQTDENYPCL